MQHLQTAMLLNECSRINREMLECIMPGNSTVTTYGQNGTKSSHLGGRLIDTEK